MRACVDIAQETLEPGDFVDAFEAFPTVIGVELVSAGLGASFRAISGEGTGVGAPPVREVAPLLGNREDHGH